MELYTSIHLSARHLPIQTFKKIKETIQWQITNEYFHMPFMQANMKENGYGMPSPSFSINSFSQHNEISSNPDLVPDGCYVFRDMARHLIREFSYTHQEVKQLDIVLSFASAEYAKIEKRLDGTETNFLLHTELTPEIILDPEPGLTLIEGLKTYW